MADETKETVKVTVTPTTSQLREGAKAPKITVATDKVPRTDAPISVTSKNPEGK